MNIVYCLDNKNYHALYVSLHSLLSNYKGSDISIYIIHSDISKSDQDNFISFFNKFIFCKIEFIFFNDNILKKYFKISMSHITMMTFARLFIPELLQQVNKILYIDTDTLILGNIYDISKIDFDGSYVLAVGEATISRIWEHLNIPTSRYFNAGVLYMDCEKLRAYNFSQKSVDFYQNNKDSLIFQDQDVLNGILYDKWKEIDVKYNYQSTYEYIRVYFHLEKVSPVIVHFTGTFKPWNFLCHNRYTKIYRNESYKTPYPITKLGAVFIPYGFSISKLLYYKVTRNSYVWLFLKKTRDNFRGLNKFFKH